MIKRFFRFCLCSYQDFWAIHHCLWLFPLVSFDAFNNFLQMQSNFYLLFCVKLPTFKLPTFQVYFKIFHLKKTPPPHSITWTHQSECIIYYMLHSAERVPKLQWINPGFWKRKRLFLSSPCGQIVTGTASESRQIARVLWSYKCPCLLHSNRNVANLGYPVTTMKSIDIFLRLNVDT